MTVKPRTVTIRLAYGPPFNPEPEQYYTRVFSPTPVPALLQKCREGREGRDLGLYQRVSAADYFPHCSDPEPPYKRYFWLNWDTDMIDIHD
ncbi:hypothetical protein QBC32DRAFT_200994, partial [Pseudoneurospora amorphoporcata]